MSKVTLERFVNSYDRPLIDIALHTLIPLVPLFAVPVLGKKHLDLCLTVVGVFAVISKGVYSALNLLMYKDLHKTFSTENYLIDAEGRDKLYGVKLINNCLGVFAPILGIILACDGLKNAISSAFITSMISVLLEIVEHLFVREYEWKFHAESQEVIDLRLQWENNYSNECRLFDQNDNELNVFDY